MDREIIEELKRQSVAQLLFKCARIINERAVQRLREASGLQQLRVTHTALFPHLDLEGTRLTTLAERLGVTKQAAGQLVDELEAMGALERKPDPSDGRAKLICFAPDTLEHGLGHLKDLEDELGLALGEDSLAALHKTLLRLEGALEEGLLDPEREEQASA